MASMRAQNPYESCTSHRVERRRRRPSRRRLAQGTGVQIRSDFRILSNRSRFGPSGDGRCRRARLSRGAPAGDLCRGRRGAGRGRGRRAGLRAARRAGCRRGTGHRELGRLRDLDSVARGDDRFQSALPRSRPSALAGRRCAGRLCRFRPRTRSRVAARRSGDRQLRPRRDRSRSAAAHGGKALRRGERHSGPDRAGHARRLRPHPRRPRAVGRAGRQGAGALHPCQTHAP